MKFTVNQCTIRVALNIINDCLDYEEDTLFDDGMPNAEVAEEFVKRFYSLIEARNRLTQLSIIWPTDEEFVEIDMPYITYKSMLQMCGSAISNLITFKQDIAKDLIGREKLYGSKLHEQ